MKTTNSNNQFTPGPWRAVLEPSSLPKNNHFTVEAASPHMAGLRQTICDINGPYAHANYRDNARLIAASPDLLAACQNAANVLAGLATGQLTKIDKDSPALAMLRAAIAKATKGE